jgi:hypothetical protein
MKEILEQTRQTRRDQIAVIRARLSRKFLLALLVASGVACGGSDTPPLASDAPASVSRAAGDPGERYLAAINPVNCLVEELGRLERQASLGDGSFDAAVLPQVQDVWGRLASARRTAVRVLLNDSWPTDVDAEIRKLASIWAQAAERNQALADAYDLGVYNVTIQSFNNNPLDEPNPGLIRALLNVGSAQETNRC